MTNHLDHEPVTYSAESALRAPRRLLRDLVSDLRRAPSVAYYLMLRDLRAQYRDSYLGFAWAFLPPIALAVSLTAAGRSQVVQFDRTDIPYPAYVMFGMILWQTFYESMSGPVDAVSQNRLMLTRMRFPREAIVIAKAGEVSVHFMVKMLLMAALFILFPVPLAPTAVLALPAVASLIVFGTLVGVLIAPLGGIFRDVPRGLTLAASAWFFATPIIYPMPSGAGPFATVVRCNPLTPLVLSIRELATVGSLSLPFEFALVTCGSLVGLGAAWIVFRLTLPYAVERMSA